MMKRIFLFLLLAKCMVPTAQNTANAVNNAIVANLPNHVSIVGLGDPTHQERTITQYRINLIKKLVTEKGFSVIAIEGNLFNLYNAHELFVTDGDITHYENAMYSMLNSAEMEELYQFVYQQYRSGNKVRIVGFDAAFSGTAFTNSFNKYLAATNVLTSTEKADFINYLTKAQITNLKALFRRNKKVAAKLVMYTNKLLANYQPTTLGEHFFYQAVSNIHFLFSTAGAVDKRDRGMAQNIAFLEQMFPNQKIILFGSSTHLLKNPTQITTTYFKKHRGETLGNLLYKTKANAYCFIAYTGLSGNKSSMFNNPKPLPKLSEASVEYSIQKTATTKATYITQQMQPQINSTESRFLGHSFVPLHLWSVVDVLVLIQDIEPCKIKW